MRTLYVIYDRVAQDSGPIFDSVNDGVAFRQFRALMQNVGTNDIDSYQLLKLGEIDTVTLVIKPFDAPEDITPALPKQLDIGSGVKE